MDRLLLNENDDSYFSFFSASVFDKLGEGWILSADLRDVMTHLGERLSDPEVDDMLKEADRDGNGRIFYQGDLLPFFSFCLPVYFRYTTSNLVYDTF